MAGINKGSQSDLQMEQATFTTLPQSITALLPVHISHMLRKEGWNAHDGLPGTAE